MEEEVEQIKEISKEIQPQKGILSRLEELEKKTESIKLTEKQKSKLFRLKFPGSVKSKMKKAWKKNNIAVIRLYNNNIAKPCIGELINGNLIVDGIHHDGGKQFMWLWRGKVPIMIVPEWDINPIGTKQYIDAIGTGTATDAERVVLKAIKMEQQGSGKKLGGMNIIWIGIGAIVVGYLIFSNFGK